jgi:hypothetical protein
MYGYGTGQGFQTSDSHATGGFPIHISCDLLAGLIPTYTETGRLHVYGFVMNTFSVLRELEISFLYII